VVRQLAGLGAREVALIGGEAYLHAGFLDVVRAIAAAGLRASMTTGGRGFDKSLAQAAAQAGMQSVSVSIDGIGPTHDVMRAAPGSFASATAALDHVRAAGMAPASNINVNRWNQHELESVYEHVRDRGVRGWQVQLTVPLGRAADRPDLLLQPYDLLDLMPRIAELKKRAFSDGILLSLGNNLGYFGPEEGLLRSITPDGEDHWQGCQAGRFVLGIESNGGVKGCPSLQSTPYVGGHLRDRTLADLWSSDAAIGFTRKRTVEDLWGFCRRCDFAEHCMGGCSFTAHALFGRPGNNPYCHYRARTLAHQGVRERLVRIERAPGLPFDNGRFELVEEPIDAPDPRPARSTRLLQVR
jgi:radical SAM protein with 4Fe4S-binding SPASM domain